MTLGGRATATTNSAGGYSFSNVPDGSYTLTPALAAASLTLARTVVLNGADVTGQDFSGPVSQWYASSRPRMSGWRG